MGNNCCMEDEDDQQQDSSEKSEYDIDQNEEDILNS
jgi:hypothetical protein